MEPEPVVRDRVYIGIDPGMHGGMVAIRTGAKGYTYSAALCRMDRYNIKHWIQHKVSLVGDTNIFALIEKVGGFIAGEGVDGKKRNIASAHTMFTLGESYGLLQMALVCSHVTFFEIRPQEWQDQIGIKSKLPLESENKYKNRLKIKAIELFQCQKITKDVADAYLLAYLCKQRFDK